MRKIQIKEVAEKKRKTSYMVMGLVLIGLMVLSSVGYSFLQNSDSGASATKKYNGLTFQQYGISWRTNINGNDFYFQYLPQDVENVSVGFFVSDLNSYSNKPLYFVNSGSATNEILQNLGGFVLRYQEACINSSIINNVEKCSEFPIKNCETDNIIIFDLNTNQTKVLKDKNCVYLSGDFIRASDAFLYKLLGVIS